MNAFSGFQKRLRIDVSSSRRRRLRRRRRGNVCSRSFLLSVLASAIFAFPSVAPGSDFLASAPISGSVLGVSVDGSGNVPSLLDASPLDAGFAGSGDSIGYSGSLGSVDSTESERSAFSTSNGTLDAGFGAVAQEEALAEERARLLGHSAEDRALAARLEERRFGDAKILVPKATASSESVAISAEFGWKGEDDELGEVYVLCGDCRISQGASVVAAPSAVVWRSSAADGETCQASQPVRRNGATTPSVSQRTRSSLLANLATYPVLSRKQR